MRGNRYALLFVVLLGFCIIPLAAWAGSVEIQVGYADNLRPSPFFPSDFCNGGTQFDGSSGAGCVQTFDAGAIRIINNTGALMTISDVNVQASSTTSYDIWNTGGIFTVAAGTDEVLTQTTSFNFDSSDNGNAFSPGNGFIPTVSITFTDPNVNGGAATTLTFNDTGQILNTGGFDTVNGVGGSCIGGNNVSAGNVPGSCNESLQWRDIGTADFTNPGGAPEPSSVLLLLTGVGGILSSKRRYFR